MKNQTTVSNKLEYPEEGNGAIELVLDNLEGTYLFIDRNYRIKHTNRATIRSIREEFDVDVYPGFLILDLAPVERRPDLIKLYDDVFSGNDRVSETAIPQKDGSLKYFENKFRPARNEDGQIVGAIVSSKDISSSRLSQLILQEAEERWRFALEGSNQGVWDWNLETNEIIYSTSYKKLYGFKEDEIANDVEEWKKRIHPDDSAKVAQALKKHLQSDDPYYESVYRIRGKNNKYKWVLARGMIVGKNSSGKALRMTGTHTDITDRVIAEENYKLLFYNNPLPMWTYSLPTLRFTDVNNAAIEHYGYSREEFLSMTIADIRPEEELALFHKEIKEREKSGARRSIWKHRKKNGEVIDVEISTHKFEKPDEPSVLVLANDVTQQIRMQEEIRKSSERFDIMMEATHDLIWDWDLQTNTVYRDESGLKKVYGVADNDSLRHIYAWIKRVHPDDRERVQLVIGQIMQVQDRDTFDVEYRFLRDDGTYSFVYDRGKIIRNAERKPIRMIGAAQDITERKRLEKELLKKELERQKAINQATVETQENERSEIGKELHDNVNQVLTTTKLYLDLALSNPELKDELISKSTKNIISVINEIRQLSRSLMDPSIGDLGLIDSLHDLIENINLTRKLHVKLLANRSIESLLDRNQKLTVFRIIQEALNNAMKHARASFVNISIKAGGTFAEIMIEDDGVGFNPDTIKKGAGLKNIQNRIYLINGTQTLQTAPDKGCKILIKFPI